MAVIRSPFSRDNRIVPRGVNVPVDDQGGSLLDQIRQGAQSGQPSRVSAPASVAPQQGLSPAPASGPRAGRDDQRQLTARELQQIARGEISGLRGEVPSDVAARAGQQIRDVAAGGETPSGGVGAAFGTVGRGLLKGLEYALFPQRGVQAGLAVVGEGLKVVGQPLAEDINRAIAGAGARVPVSTSTAGRRPTQELERLIPTVDTSKGRGILEVGVGRRPSGRSYRELVSDPTFMLTIPNIRDNVKIPKTGIGPIDSYLKFGLYGLDAAIELGFQGATDPLSYVTFGASQFAGQGGRAALAGRLLQKDAVDVAPSLLNNPERLYRLGEWGLTRAERTQLANAGILQPAGMSWNFGERNAIWQGSKLGQTISGELARGVGSPVAQVRAAVGDLPLMQRVAQFTTPQSRRQLTGVARGQVVGADARRSIVNYAAQQNARGVYGRVSQVLASRHAPLIAEVAASPFRNDIGRVIESQITGGMLPTGAPVDPVALDLASRVSAAFDDMRQTYNDTIVDFMRRYDLDPQYAVQIADIENYFYHTLTPEAQRWVASQGRDMAPDLIPQVTQTLNIGPNEMKVGGGPIRGRKLKANEEWLGERLNTGSIEEINLKWREKTGANFDWFETDTASVMTSYINSIANQSKRVAYADKLFAYGDEFILPLMSKVIPDKGLVDAAGAAVKELNKERAAVIRRITGVAYTGGSPREGAKVLEGVRRLAQKVVDDGIQSVDVAEDAMLQALTRLRAQEQKLAAATEAARQQGSNISTAYEAMIAPIRARIAGLEKAIAKGEGARELARQELLDEHTRLFPRRQKRPQDVQTLAAEISGAQSKRFDQKIRALETRGGRAQRAAERAAGAVTAVEGRIETAQQGSLDFRARINRLRAVEEATSNADPEFFPDGLIYTTVDHVSESADYYSASYWFGSYDLDVPEGQQLVAVPAPSKDATFDLSSSLDDQQEIVMFLPFAFSTQLGEDVFGSSASGWADWVVSESERLIAAPRGTDLDPRVPDELKPLVAAIVGWGWQSEVSPDVYRLYASEIVDALNGLQAAAGRKIDPELSEQILHTALVTAADASDRGVGSRVKSVIVPSIEWEDDYSVLVSSGNALRVMDDPELGGIVEGSQAWVDVVPPEPASVRAAAVEPVVEPTVEPTVAATGGGAASGVTVEMAREVIGGQSVWATRTARVPELNKLVDDARKLNRRVAGGDLPADKADLEFAKLIDQLDSVTDMDEKAHLLAAAYNTPSAQRNRFLDEVEDRFGLEVEFAIGNAAAGNGTDNFSRGVQQKARANPETYQPFIADAAKAASVKKPAAYAKLDKKSRDALVGAADQVAAGGVVEPAAAATFTEPSGAEPFNRLQQLMELETGPESEAVAARLAQVPELEQEAVGLRERAAEQAARVGEVERSARATRGAYTRGTRKLEERVGRATDRTVRVGRETLTERQATGRVTSEQRKLANKERELNRALDSDPVLKQVPKEQRTLDKLATVFDTAKTVVAEREAWQQNVLPLLEADVARITQLIDQGNAKFPDVQAAMRWAENVRDISYQLNNPAVFDMNPQLAQAWERTTKALFAQEAQLAELEARIVVADDVAKRLESAQVGAQMAKDVLDGWVELERLGVQIPRELRDEMFAGVRRLESPREWGNLMRYYYSYQRFFKTYAISTPGFIVRNSMTSAFNNLVAGVRASDQSDAVKFATVYFREGLDGALKWAERRGQRARFEQAFEAVTRAGGGQAIDELIPMVKGRGSRAYNNWYTRGFQRANEASEIAARMGLALDATTRGLSIEENAARIARYHFDYSDISQLDAIAKAFIPFWTFASRNVQLQLVNRILRPNLYNRWEDVKELGPEVDDEDWPIYLRDRGVIPLSATSYLAPDLPQNDLVEQARRLSDPVLLLSQANPLIRTAAETVSNRSLAFDYPYSTKQQELGVTDWPSALVGELLDVASFGRTNRSRPTQGTATAFVKELVPSMVPPLQQAQRYIQAAASAAGASPETQAAIGGRESYRQRDPLAVLATYLGIPYQTLTPEQLQSELRRRQYGIQDIAQRARGG